MPSLERVNKFHTLGGCEQGYWESQGPEAQGHTHVAVEPSQYGRTVVSGTSLVLL